MRGHFAELDGFFGPDKARELEAKLRGLGKDAQICASTPASTTPSSTTTVPRCTPPSRPPLAWDETIEFFRSTIR